MSAKSVKIKRLSAFLLVLVSMLSLCACAQDATPCETTVATEATESIPLYETLSVKNPALATYLYFVEKKMVDSPLAIQKYCHYEEADKREIALRQNILVTSYEILEYRKLSDRLWVISGAFTDVIETQGYNAVHFVGIIDGAYYVMLSANQIPRELKEGLDLSKYAHDEFGYLDP